MMTEGPTETRAGIYNPQRPVCRHGIEARTLSNGMVYLRHPQFSSQILKRETWAFLQLCDGRSLEDLKAQIAASLGYQLTLDQVRESVSIYAGRGLFEGTREADSYYRLFDASALIAHLAPLVRWLASKWCAALTLAALLACLALLLTDWERFVNAVAQAARAQPVATVLLYYLTFIPIALLHELGHALVIGFHGGEVPEIVIRRNAHFAVLTNASVLKERLARVWYLSMGTVIDVYIWLALLIAFHFTSSYWLLVFLLPQTIYFLLYSYSIFQNSDYLKAIAAWLGQPVPARPWEFINKSWRQPPESVAARKLLYLMTLSLVIKLSVTAFLIWTFARIEPLVLALYALYRLMIYALGHWPQWARRWRSAKRQAPRPSSV
jgi:hypothetical protein